MRTAKRKEPGARKRTGAAVPAAGPTQPPWWVYAIGFAVALGAVFSVYAPAMNGPFVLDDLYLPFMSPNFPHALAAWIGGLRPALMFSYWLNYQTSGAETGPYHAWNAILHWMDAVVVFFLVRRILQWAKVEGARLDWFAAFGAGVFLLHPLQTESVAYVASRSEVLSVLLFNCALAVFVYRRSEAISVSAAVGVLILFAGATLSKEHTAILPAMLLLTDYFWNPGFGFSGIKKNWKLYAPILAGGALGGAYVLRVIRDNPTAGFAIKEFTWYQYFFTQCRMIWRYLTLFVLPVGQNLDPEVAVSRNAIDHGAILGLLALVAAAVAAWIYRKRYPLAAYGWFATLILLAPTSSFIPIRDVYAERRTYLPFLGLLFIVMELLRRWKASGGIVATSLVCVLAAEGAMTHARAEIWGNGVALWRDTVRESPKKVRPNFQLAKAYFDVGQCGEAVAQYAKTAELAPPDFTLLVDWGLALDCAQQPEEAIAKLEAAKRTAKPATLSAAYLDSQIAKVYGTWKRYPEAMAALEEAQKLDPNYDMVYFYRGTVLYNEGDVARAGAEFQRAVQLNPNNEAARNAMETVARALAGQR